MKKVSVVVLLLVSLALAVDFQPGKVTHIELAHTQNGLQRWANSDGGSAVIPPVSTVLLITVELADMSYTGQYKRSTKFDSGTLTIGDQVPARIEKDKLILQAPDGTEVKGKIVLRQRVSASAQ